MKISIIGSGVMGSAIAKSLLNQNITSPEKLNISDTNLEKLNFFSKLGVNVSNNNLESIQDTDIVILAIKPQNFPVVLNPLKSSLKPDTLILSIAAGVTIESIQKFLQHQKVIRVMPNTPAKISAGMSGWFADQSVNTKDKKQIKQILNSFGQEVEVETEDQIDSITALSGSGPAYVFLFLQGLTEGGIQLGLSEKAAQKAALQTVLGSVKLAFNTKEDLDTLIENVTSKGGTTAAAREKFATLKFKEVIHQSMQAAYNRAKELAQN